MKKRIECVIAGVVQGVFFRDYAKTEADALGVFGFVKNNPDGSVSVVAEGEEEKLKEFLEKLRAGTKYSRVENVKTSWSDSTEKFSDFRIEF